MVVTGILTDYSRDSAVEAHPDPRRQGHLVGLEEDGVRGGRRDPGSKYDKALSLKVPVLDEAGFAALLADGPDAARALATNPAEPEPAEPESATGDCEPKKAAKKAARKATAKAATPKKAGATRKAAAKKTAAKEAAAPEG